jgi:SET domain-containing protein
MKKYYVDNSKIHGLGIHAIKNIKQKDLIGHVCTAMNLKDSNFSDVLDSFKTELSDKLKTIIKRTELERYLNHSNQPNAICIAKGNEIFLIAIKNISKDEEITVQYKDAYKVLDEAQIIVSNN